jgi:hypothetical protein
LLLFTLVACRCCTCSWDCVLLLVLLFAVDVVLAVAVDVVLCCALMVFLWLLLMFCSCCGFLIPDF